MIPITLACMSPEVLPSHCTLILPPQPSHSMALVPFSAKSTPATKQSKLTTPSMSTPASEEKPPIEAFGEAINKISQLTPVDDTLDQILRFITGLRTRKIINREDSVLLEDYLFGDNLIIPSAYAVALSTSITSIFSTINFHLGANDAEYFAEICRDLASNLKTTRGRTMCSAQEEMLDVCESLFEQRKHLSLC